MWPDPTARPRVARCNAATQATAAQVAALSALPDPVEPVTAQLACELADGHADDHAALAVASHGGDQWWWLRWDRRRHDVVQIDPCEATEHEAPGPEFCLFPAGHPGPHSFKLQPGPDRGVNDGPAYGVAANASSD
jgi:hypothetical protein